MTFWQHIEELRKVLLRSLYLLSIVTLAFLIFHESLLSIFSYPLRNLSPYPTADYQALKQVCIGNSKNYPILIELNEKIEKLELLQAKKLIQIFSKYPLVVRLFFHSRNSILPSKLEPNGGTINISQTLLLAILNLHSPFYSFVFLFIYCSRTCSKRKKTSLSFYSFCSFFLLYLEWFLPISSPFL